jgi:hypothetical protein
VRPLSLLAAGEARRLAGLIFDLDDTLLDHGALTEAAYGALFRLRASGLRLIACTGRPAGWGEVLQRQWPLDATVVENGALAFVTRRATPVGGAERRARRAGLLELAAEIVERFPETALADDNDARRTDVTLDIGEHRQVGVVTVQTIRALARERGVRTLASSIHLHLTLEADDKASGTLRLLGQQFGEDATAARSRYAFAGDSANDAAAFAAFHTTFGVANVASHLRGLTVPPRYLADASMGLGFAEIAARLITLRAPGA